jgi:hypothetical protein
VTTLDRWRAVAARVDLSLLPFGLKLSVTDDFVIKLECTAKDRQGRGDVELCWWWGPVSNMDDASRTCDAAVVSFIRDALVGFLRHEADEAFLYEGKRIYDPHREETRP